MSRTSVRVIGILGALCAGMAARVAAADDDIFICRFTSTAGTPDDTNFNSAGLAGPPGCFAADDGPTGRNDEFYDVEADSAGRVVACGNNAKNDGSEGFMIMRLLSNGVLDGNFGESGFVLKSWPAARACATDSNDRIVAAAAFGPPSNGIVVARFKAVDGSLDSSFGPFGMGFEWIPTASPTVADLKIIGGRIWIAGDGVGFKVARLTANGVLDTNFGTGGIANGTWTQTYAIGVDQIGRAVLAVQNPPTVNGFPQMGAARLSMLGAVETTFGMNAREIGFSGFNVSQPGGVQVDVDSQGRILLGGYAANTSGANFASALVHPSGLVQSRVTTAFSQPWALGTKMARKNAGSYFLAGNLSSGFSGTGHRSIALALYTSTALDTTFSGDGKTTHDFVTQNANVTALTVDSDGRPIVAGYISP